jgi:hypothetical protein
VERRVARRQQQAVAIAQGDFEMIGEVQDHLAARARPTGLEEADVTGGDSRLERQLELAEAAALPPGAEQLADGRWRGDGHRPKVSLAAAWRLPLR